MHKPRLTGDGMKFDENVENQKRKPSLEAQKRHVRLPHLPEGGGEPVASVKTPAERNPHRYTMYTGYADRYRREVMRMFSAAFLARRTLQIGAVAGLRKISSYTK